MVGRYLFFFKKKTRAKVLPIFRPLAWIFFLKRFFASFRTIWRLEIKRVFFLMLIMKMHQGELCSTFLAQLLWISWNSSDFKSFLFTYFSVCLLLLFSILYSLTFRIAKLSNYQLLTFIYFCSYQLLCLTLPSSSRSSSNLVLLPRFGFV